PNAITYPRYQSHSESVMLHARSTIGRAQREKPKQFARIGQRAAMWDSLVKGKDSSPKTH
ncbi:MAG: hypothetical protein ACPHL6_07970, partial [Rubripirellula sp.]